LEKRSVEVDKKDNAEAREKRKEKKTKRKVAARGVRLSNLPFRPSPFFCFG
jgi:hypothetical protein